MKRLLVTLFILSAPAYGQGANVTAQWTNPTQNVDGSTIPASGPGSLTSTRLEWGTCSGTAFGTRIAEQIVAAPATSFTITNLGPGTYCFRAFSRNTFGQESAPSGVVQRVIAPPVPNPPTLTTVAVVAGLNMAPLYRINADGSRGAVVVGFIPVGSECSGPVVYRYRDRNYHRPSDLTEIKWWATSPTSNVAAPCA